MYPKVDVSLNRELNWNMVVTFSFSDHFSCASVHSPTLRFEKLEIFTTYSLCCIEQNQVGAATV